MCSTLALILTFSPGEKEQRLDSYGFASDCPANPVAGFRVRRRTILFSFGAKAGIREVVKHSSVRWKSGENLLIGHCFLDAPRFMV